MSNQHERQQQFDLLLPIAEAAGGETWIRDNFQDNSFEVWRIADTEQLSRYGVNRSFWHWQTETPDVIEPIHYKNISAKWEPTSQSEGNTGARLNLAYLTSLFIKRAVDVGELAHYTTPLIQHIVRNKEETRFGNVPNDLVAKSLLLPENPFLVPDSPLIAGLKSMEPGDNRLTGAITTRIGKFLLGNIESKASLQIKRDPAHKQKLLEMLLALNEHELVPLDFWYSYGINAGLVFEYPEILETVVEKLSTPEGAQMLRGQKISQPLNVITGYVNNLLAHYAKDETRDQKKIRTAIETIATPLGGTILGRLVSIGQGVTLAMNRDLSAKYGADEEDLLSSLDPTQTVQAGEALFRILEIIRLPNLTADQVLQQQEQDTLHTALIETLHMALLRGAIQRNTGDMRLRFGQETNIEELMGQLPAGQFPFQVAAYSRKKKRQADSPVRGNVHNLHKPGSGLLS